MLEARVLNRDAGFAREGHPVAAKLEAFLVTRYGMVAGKIESVSSDAVRDEKLRIVYTARVTSSGNSVERGDPCVRLTPSSTANFKTGGALCAT